MVLAGLAGGMVHADKMGAYTLVPAQTASGRAVWQAVGGADRFIYYAPAYKQWFVSDRADMEAGATSGWLYVGGAELMPQLCGSTWRVAKGSAKETDASDFTDVDAVKLCRKI